MPHSRIQVELGFILQAGTCQILNFAQNPRQSQSVQGTELNWGEGTPHRKSVYREGGTPHIFSEQGANRGGHRIYFLNRGPMGGTLHIKIDKLRVGGWFPQNNATLWLHLASWNLPDSQLS